MDKKTFELLCIDSRNNTVIENEANLFNRLIGNGKLWKNAKLDKKVIADTALGIKLSAAIVNSNPDTTKIIFSIKVEGEDQLEAFRIRLINALKDEKFDYIYILQDDISKELCKEIYPSLYEVENLLRKYLTLFFATKIGPKWWNDIASDELNKKINTRKNNEEVFSKRKDSKGNDETLCETKSFLIDFKDLGEVIYRVSAGNLTSSDITKRIESLDENNNEKLSQEVVDLKKAIKTNIKKFFPSFETVDFQKKWEYLYTIRNRIAHNSLLVKDDSDLCKTYTSELITFLKTECQNIILMSIDDDSDQEIIEQYQTNIVMQSSKYDFISKKTLAWELYKMDDYSKRHQMEYIGLKHFVVNILGLKGFDIRHSYEIIKEMEEEKYIEIYEHVNNFKGIEIQVAAIKILKSLSELYQ